jgi:hypothetical protein
VLIGRPFDAEASSSHIAIEIIMAKTMAMLISFPLTSSDPTFSDTPPPKNTAPMMLRIPPSTTAVVTENTLAPTAGAMASSLLPIANATMKPMSKRAANRSGSK